jgi:hypothetical protein
LSPINKVSSDRGIISSGQRERQDEVRFDDGTKFVYLISDAPSHSTLHNHFSSHREQKTQKPTRSVISRGTIPYMPGTPPSSVMLDGKQITKSCLDPRSEDHDSNVVYEESDAQPLARPLESIPEGFHHPKSDSISDSDFLLLLSESNPLSALSRFSPDQSVSLIERAEKAIIFVPSAEYAC